MTLLVLDTETTGLDPTKTHLLELGLVVVDDNLKVQTHVSYIWPNDTPVQQLFEEADPFVQKMHTENGLWLAVHEEQQARWSQPVEGARLARVRYSEILTELYQGLAHYGIASNAKTTMVGRNPGFDLGFLKVHAPEIAGLFGHQMIDIVGIQLRCQHRYGKGVKWSKAQEHRALSDCYNEIEELKHYEGQYFLPCP
jgi:oligoribonuclease (3'-5' exoribonuclease)